MKLGERVDQPVEQQQQQQQQTSEETTSTQTEQTKVEETVKPADNDGKPSLPN